MTRDGRDTAAPRMICNESPRNPSIANTIVKSGKMEEHTYAERQRNS